MKVAGGQLQCVSGAVRRKEGVGGGYPHLLGKGEGGGVTANF